MGTVRARRGGPPGGRPPLREGGRRVAGDPGAAGKTGLAGELGTREQAEGQEGRAPCRGLPGRAATWVTRRHHPRESGPSRSVQDCVTGISGNPRLDVSILGYGGRPPPGLRGGVWAVRAPPQAPPRQPPGVGEAGPRQGRQVGLRLCRVGPDPAQGRCCPGPATARAPATVADHFPPCAALSRATNRFLGGLGHLRTGMPSPNTQAKVTAWFLYPS